MSNEINSPANLKQHRIRSGVSLDELAVALGVHSTTLWRWEKGKTTINKHLVTVWVEALHRLENEVAAEDVT